MAGIANYPLRSQHHLREQYVGKSLAAADMPSPAAVLDLAALRRNCAAMLQTVRELGVGFRAHVKTHKTTELTRLQVGEDAKDVKLVVSTLAEAEHLLPYLRECQDEGKSVNVLYGVPAAPTSIPRLAALATTLGNDSISVMIDHPDQLTALQNFPRRFSVFIKVDTGYHRAGLDIGSNTAREILGRIRDLARTCPVELAGFYSHLGSSYSVSSAAEAVNSFVREVESTAAAAEEFLSHPGAQKHSVERVTLSIGATPTATAAQNLLSSEFPEAKKVIERISKRFTIEVHAGNYPVLDLQQIATHARPPPIANPTSIASLSMRDIALTILVEVASIYGERQQPEALVAAGSLALGREPCKSYPGWGVITSWKGLDGNAEETDGLVYDEDGRTGWMVSRISQEHGIIGWEGPQHRMRRLAVGEKLQVWPNHACIAAAGFGWYLIVDSDLPPERRYKVVDVWVRWRGW